MARYNKPTHSRPLTMSEMLDQEEKNDVVGYYHVISRWDYNRKERPTTIEFNGRFNGEQEDDFYDYIEFIKDDGEPMRLLLTTSMDFYPRERKKPKTDIFYPIKNEYDREKWLPKKNSKPIVYTGKLIKHNPTSPVHDNELIRSKKYFVVSPSSEFIGTFIEHESRIAWEHGKKYERKPDPVWYYVFITPNGERVLTQDEVDNTIFHPLNSIADEMFWDPSMRDAVGSLALTRSDGRPILHADILRDIAQFGGTKIKRRKKKRKNKTRRHFI